MKFLIIKDEADGGFEPVCFADNLSNALEKFSRLKDKNPESQYKILKKS